MSVDDLDYILVHPERLQVSVFGIYANHVRTRWKYLHKQRFGRLFSPWFLLIYRISILNAELFVSPMLQHVWCLWQLHVGLAVSTAFGIWENNMSVSYSHYWSRYVLLVQVTMLSFCILFGDYCLQLCSIESALLLSREASCIPPNCCWDCRQFALLKSIFVRWTIYRTCLL